MNMQAKLQAAIDAAAQTPTTCEPLGKQNDVDAVTPLSQPVSIKTMTEKAMLCALSVSTFSPYKRDDDASAEYGAGNVSKHLFASGDNRVKEVNKLYREMQTYLRNNTVPWKWGKGVYLLNSAQYMSITAELRQRAVDIETALDDLEANWSTAVQTDYNRLHAIDPKLANYDDYPTDIRSKYGHSVNFMPVPKPEHMDPRGVSEEDIQALATSTERMLKEASKSASAHVIQQLVKPMQEAVDHLAKPVEDVKRFSKSLIGNMIDVADRMNRANVSDDPTVQRQIDDLLRVASGINMQTVKHDVQERSTAKADIETLMTRMKGLV